MSIKASELKVGQQREEVVVDDLSRTQIVMYAGASGDYNPLHSDERFAKEVAGYPSVFAHGMLTMGMTARVLTDWVGDGRLLSYGVRFSKQVWPGDTLTTTVTVKAIHIDSEHPTAEFDVTTRNQAGDNVVVGYASARLDK
ncbi:MAG: MaoC/PaaZ C-terminal domain-containing protein [Ilumatobacteraceae bacterium]